MFDWQDWNSCWQCNANNHKWKSYNHSLTFWKRIYLVGGFQNVCRKKESNKWNNRVANQKKCKACLVRTCLHTKNTIATLKKYNQTHAELKKITILRDGSFIKFGLVMLAWRLARGRFQFPQTLRVGRRQVVLAGSIPATRETCRRLRNGLRRFQTIRRIAHSHVRKWF